MERRKEKCRVAALSPLNGSQPLGLSTMALQVSGDLKTVPGEAEFGEVKKFNGGYDVIL